MREFKLPHEATHSETSIEGVVEPASPQAGPPVGPGDNGAGNDGQGPPSLDERRHRVGWMTGRRSPRESPSPLPSLLGEPLPANEKELVGVSPQMTRVKEMIPRIAATASPVLIEGESGTGKELAAVAIHRLSARHRGPFVPVNCGAIPADLLESEFFGHVRGAFTGAVMDTLGLFRAAHGGTLFLDEVTELPPPLQVKLLRVLEEKHVRPVGSTRMHAADVRIIAASNRPLEGALQDRSFRPDLFYRLNVLRLVMPPLRERKPDIPILALYLLRQFNERFGCKVQDVSPDAMAALMAYDFPGNVRELENLLERAYALGASRQIALADLPGLRPAPPALAPAETLPTLAEAEQDLILRALRLHRNDPEKAARALGISRRTINRRMKEHRTC